jgi:hypothetical protein
MRQPHQVRRVVEKFGGKLSGIDRLLNDGMPRLSFTRRTDCAFESVKGFEAFCRIKPFAQSAWSIIRKVTKTLVLSPP